MVRTRSWEKIGQIWLFWTHSRPELSAGCMDLDWVGSGWVQKHSRGVFLGWPFLAAWAQDLIHREGPVSGVHNATTSPQLVQDNTTLSLSV